jgi:RHS repeat-associated protein
MTSLINHTQGSRKCRNSSGRPSGRPLHSWFSSAWVGHGRVSTWAASNHGFVESNAYTDSAPLANRGGGQTQFEHQNWLGTERVRTTYNGAVAMSIDSLPWADGHTPSGDNGDQHDFALMDRDLEDNTEHAQFRQYSTNLGRWQSPDLYLGSYDLTNPQSFNRYTYALNNPSSLIDPSGLDPTCGTDPETGLLECTSYYPSPSFPPTGCLNPGGGTEGCIPVSCALFYSCDGPPISYPPSSSGSPVSALGPPRLALLSAPNNGNPAKTIVNKALTFYCKSSPSSRVLASVRNGALLGAARGAYFGFVSGEIFGGEVTLGLSGVAGAGLGAAIQGTIGATTGVITGFASAEACQAAGAYPPGS